MFNSYAIFILIIAISFANGSWWYLGLNSSNITKKQLLQKNCFNTKIFLTKTQRKLCTHNLKILEILGRSARLAIDECQHQFKHDRWNCTIFNQKDVFGRFIKKRTKETAFIFAINSAAAMYEITRACNKGDLQKCSCNSNRSQNKSVPNYEWNGCPDNVLFGYKMSKSFVDSKEINYNKHHMYLKEIKLINLHNNEVGRRMILKNMKQICKCHGVSGSCSIKICWKVIPEFRLIGDELTKAYQIASHLKNLNMAFPKRYLRNLSKDLQKDELVFIDKSPNFCKSNKKDGIIGTSGRVCSILEENDKNNNTKLNEIISTCEYICCGRGYSINVIETEEDCDCQFQWCCSVKCNKCKKKIIQHKCN